MVLQSGPSHKFPSVSSFTNNRRHWVPQSLPAGPSTSTWPQESSASSNSIVPASPSIHLSVGECCSCDVADNSALGVGSRPGCSKGCLQVHAALLHAAAEPHGQAAWPAGCTIIIMILYDRLWQQVIQGSQKYTVWPMVLARRLLLHGRGLESWLTRLTSCRSRSTISDHGWHRAMLPWWKKKLSTTSELAVG
jgi:hypothetical protein